MKVPFVQLGVRRSRQRPSRFRSPIWLAAFALLCGILAPAPALARWISYENATAAPERFVIGTCLGASGVWFAAIFPVQGRTYIGGGTVIGTPYLTEHHFFNATLFDDTIFQVQGWTYGTSTPVDGCAAFGPLQFNGYEFWIYGRDGNDLIAGGAPRSFIFGDAGNDTIFARGDVYEVRGGSGNDIIWTSSQTANETINGDSGSDAVCINGEVSPPWRKAEGGDNAGDCITAPFVSGRTFGFQIYNGGGNNCGGRCNVFIQ